MTQVATALAPSLYLDSSKLLLNFRRLCTPPPEIKGIKNAVLSNNKSSHKRTLSCATFHAFPHFHHGRSLSFYDSTYSLVAKHSIEKSIRDKHIVSVVS